MRELACWAKRATSMPLPSWSAMILAMAWLCWRDLRFIASKLPPRPATAWRISSRARSISWREPSISLSTNERSSPSSICCSRTMRSCSGDCSRAGTPRNRSQAAKANQLRTRVVRTAQRIGAGQSKPTAMGARTVSTSGAAMRISKRGSMGDLWETTLAVSAPPRVALARRARAGRDAPRSFSAAAGARSPRPSAGGRTGTATGCRRPGARAGPNAPPPAAGHGSPRPPRPGRGSAGCPGP